MAFRNLGETKTIVKLTVCKAQTLMGDMLLVRSCHRSLTLQILMMSSDLPPLPRRWQEMGRHRTSRSHVLRYHRYVFVLRFPTDTNRSM